MLAASARLRTNVKMAQNSSNECWVLNTAGCLQQNEISLNEFCISTGIYFIQDPSVPASVPKQMRVNILVFC